jgi:hypothetical protein
MRDISTNWRESSAVPLRVHTATERTTYTQCERGVGMNVEGARRSMELITLEPRLELRQTR